MTISVSEVEQFLYREARYLDDREFDRWLECYAPDAEFWMPAWDDDDSLTTDPQRDISLIWYGNRAGLEDRVFRIRTDRSSATRRLYRCARGVTDLARTRHGHVTRGPIP